MAIITLEELSIGFRGPNLLDGVSARVESGQRIGLLGRNGAGKTTLLRLLSGTIQPDHGVVRVAAGVRIARLSQAVPMNRKGTIRSIVLAGHGVTDSPSSGDAVDPENRWQIEHAVDSTLSRMQLDGQALFETLSSGMKRRVLLAQAIAGEPDVLLLDEPTNHLDIPSILWLEQFLQNWQRTLIFVTHDRMFLRNIANRIWEIDRGRLFDWSCDYATFVKRKDQAIAAEEKQNALFDKRLAAEEAWIRQGIKARRTRNEGRVKALQAMRKARQQRQSGAGTARLNLQQAERSGQLVADVEGISFAYDDKPVIRNFSTTLMRGDKVGILGPNGAGKTTLLKLLLGQLSPDSGTVKLGTNLQIAYFDQLRDSLDPEKTVAENVGEGTDRIRIGDNTKHIVGYLQDFLFTPERARMPVKFLSGGERNRALLAKLMTKAANVLVLDEPTNDLDSETLELLESQIVAFGGTVLLVSHDRAFLNNVVTSTIVFEDGEVNEYVGGYDQWCEAVARRQAATEPKATATSQPFGGGEKTSRQATARRTVDKPTEAKAVGTKPAKLSYKDQRELDGLPARIERLEAEIAELHEAMARPDYYQQDGQRIAETARQLQQHQDDLNALYERWEALEQIREGA